MDLKRLRTFVAVAEHGGVSHAATRLRITQPALSRQLQDLQQELGVKLFELVGRRLLLTGEGEELLPHCHGLLSHAGAFAERALSLSRGDAGVLRMAASPQMIESVFPSFLSEYARRRPGVHVRPVEAGAVAQAVLLERGEVHLAVGFEPGSGSRFASLALPPFHVLVAYSPSLPIRGDGEVDVRTLVDVPLLLLDRGFGTRKHFDAACRLARLEPSIFLESGAVHTLLALAEAGFGVAVVPDSVRIRGELRIARLVFRGEPLGAPLAILWDKLRPLPRYAEGFREAFAKHMREVYPISGPPDVERRRVRAVPRR
jgi:DNA-binding transcriptional LysR family regulator